MRGISGILARLTLGLPLLLAVGCATSETYDKFALSGVAYAEGTESFATEAVKLHIDSGSYMLIRCAHKIRTSRLDPVGDCSNAADGLQKTKATINAVEKQAAESAKQLLAVNKLLKKYFTLLHQLASGEQQGLILGELDQLVAKFPKSGITTIPSKAFGEISNLATAYVIRQRLEKDRPLLTAAIGLQIEKTRDLLSSLASAEGRLRRLREELFVDGYLAAAGVPELTNPDRMEKLVTYRYSEGRMVLRADQLEALNDTADALLKAMDPKNLDKLTFEGLFEFGEKLKKIADGIGLS